MPGLFHLPSCAARVLESSKLQFGSKMVRVAAMPTDIKLPAIEHIKARKDGLDVLADIYRYAELGFDAIDADDLALFRWYGIYTQRAQESAESGVPGPSEETDGHFMLRIKFPGGVVSSEQLRTIG